MQKRIIIYQERTISYTSRFTWGEGYEEREHIHYGAMGIYIEQPLPTRLIADLKEIKQAFLDKKSDFVGEDGDCYKVVRTLRHLANNEAILIVDTHNVKDVEGLVEIDDIQVPSGIKSIYNYIRIHGIYEPCADIGPISLMLSSIKKFDENQILNVLDLRFNEDYWDHVDSAHASDLIKLIMICALERILIYRSEVIISNLNSFNLETIRYKLYEAISITPEGNSFIPEDEIIKSINNSTRYCIDLYLQKTVDEMLNSEQMDNYQDTFKFLESCRHASIKVDFYINQGIEGVLSKKKKYILESKDRWNYETIYDLFRASLPEKYYNDDNFQRRTISCSKELFKRGIEQILEPNYICDYQAEYKYLRALFPRVIGNALTCELNAKIEKCIYDLLNVKIKTIIETIENIDYSCAYRTLKSCIPDSTSLFNLPGVSKLESKYHKYISFCCEIFMKHRIEELLKSNIYLHPNAVITAIEPCLPSVENELDLTHILRKYSSIYIDRWLEKNNYIKKFKDNIIGRENFRTEEEYKEFAIKYLNEAPEHFDETIIQIIINKIFTNFRMPARFVKVEVEKLAGPKIIGKIDLDKLYKK